MAGIPGIHHITAIAGDPQRNLDFYSGLLGLRLVKLTVNFDAPGTYHFYFGDELGRPGTLLTFFPQPEARAGRHGVGQASVVAFAIPPEAVRYWMARFGEHHVEYEGPIGRGDQQLLSLFDPDGLQVELVASADAAAREPWREGPVPPEQALRGLYGVTLIEESLEPAAGFLTQVLGFEPLGAGANHRHRFALGSGSDRRYVDVLALPGLARGQMGAGAIHHVAWRTPDAESQQAWQAELRGRGLQVTPVLDRKYFTSIYFREPGGVLFEIATDGPGFTADEQAAALGSSLRLPEALEPERAAIESRLPAVQLPGRLQRMENG